MIDRLAARYRRFAEVEAHGRSPLYEALALAIADDPDVLAFLATLPEAKQQPNLIFGAMQFLCDTIPEWRVFRTALFMRAEAVRTVVETRTTQTNEPGRCAVLLPVLATLPQPLALIEVGASAGLCLLPDRYGYDYDGQVLGSADGPVFPCHLEGLAPPGSLPEVMWRAGLDLAPVDLAQRKQVLWLESLVWPDQQDRLARLKAAVAVAKADPPRVVQGDLSSDLAGLRAEAPADVTQVVFHTAVLAYVSDPAARAAFVGTVRESGAVWISNEAPDVLPEIAARAGTPPRAGCFLLAVDGVPVAWTDPHGAWAVAVETVAGAQGGEAATGP
jgi:hypothetical protein